MIWRGFKVHYTNIRGRCLDRFDSYVKVESSRWYELRIPTPTQVYGAMQLRRTSMRTTRFFIGRDMRCSLHLRHGVCSPILHFVQPYHSRCNTKRPCWKRAHQEVGDAFRNKTKKIKTLLLNQRPLFYQFLDKRILAWLYWRISWLSSKAPCDLVSNFCSNIKQITTSAS